MDKKRGQQKLSTAVKSLEPPTSSGTSCIGFRPIEDDAAGDAAIPSEAGGEGELSHVVPFATTSANICNEANLAFGCAFSVFQASSARIVCRSEEIS